MTHIKLIEGCIAKDKASEKALFLRFSPLVFTIARRYCRDIPEAEDLVHDVFIKLYTKLPQYEANKGSFEGWLRRLTTNHLINYLRRQKKYAFIDYVDELPSVAIDEEEMKHISPEQLHQAILELPIGYRTILNLYVFESWSHKEIAKSLQITEATSRSQLSRAKKLLSTYLKKNLTHHETKLV